MAQGVGRMEEIKCIPGGLDVDERGIVSFVNDFDFNNLDYSGIKYTDKTINDLNNHLIDKSKIDFTDAIILTDDKPALEKMLMNPALEWRKSLNKIFRNRLIEQNQAIFY